MTQDTRRALGSVSVGTPSLLGGSNGGAMSVGADESTASTAGGLRENQGGGVAASAATRNAIPLLVGAGVNHHMKPSINTVNSASIGSSTTLQVSSRHAQVVPPAPPPAASPQLQQLVPFPIAGPMNSSTKGGAPPLLVPSSRSMGGIPVAPSIALEAQVHGSIPGGRLISSLNHHPSSTSANPPIMDLWTPEIFRNRRLRSGKWIKEEEVYAEALIELFEKGLASDCTSGCTLRAYLSKKLHCAPMRISKKYAGKGIGKLAFVPQMAMEATTGTATSRVSEEDVRAKEAVVQKKAEAFYLAVFQCHEYLGVPLGFLFNQGTEAPATGMLTPPLPHVMSQPKSGALAGMPMGAAAPAAGALPLGHPASFAPQGAIPTPILPHGGGTSLPGGGIAVVASTDLPVGAPQAGNGLPHATSAPHLSQQATSHVVNQHTLQLQQTYLNALHHQPPSQSGVTSMTSALATTASSNGGAMPPPPPQILHMQQQQPQLQAAPVSVNASAVRATPLGVAGSLHPWQPTNGSKQPNLVQQAQALGMSTKSTTPQSPPTVPQDPLKELASPQAPDFLTGFDRVALSLNPMSTNSSSDGRTPATGAEKSSLPHGAAESSLLHCSPTFTSRSFDDFHRFLGQDLVSLESPLNKQRHEGGAAAAVTVASESAPPFPMHELNGSGKSVGRTTIANGNHHYPDLSHANQQSLARNSTPDSHPIFSAESYAVFASAAVAASSQHAAYLAPGAMLGSTHPSSTTRARADTFDMDSTMNLVSAHLERRPRRSSHDSHGTTTAPVRTRTYHCSAVTVPPTRESLLERMYGPRLANLVSGSEPSTSSAAETESGQGSMPSSASSSGGASESEDVPSDHFHSEEQSSDSDHTGDSESESNVPKCKKAKISSSCSEGITEQHCGF